MRVSLATASSSLESPNEDFAAVSDSLAVLLDGATIPPGVPVSCPHGARWFARALGGRIFADLSAELDKPIADAVADAIAATAKLHGETCAFDDRTHPSATVAVLRVSLESSEFFVLGDSTIVLDSSDAAPPIARTDRRIAHVAVDERERARRMAPGTAERQSARAELLEAERAARNSPGGYWIAATKPEAASHAIQGRVDRGLLRRAALMTDGAANAVDRYGLMDWSHALDIMESGEPQQIIQEVRRAENGDPEGSRWPRSKRSDDATVIFCGLDDCLPTR